MIKTLDRKHFNIDIGRVLGVIFLLLLIAVSTLPFVWTLLSSFKTNREILNSAMSLPESWSLRNYIGVLTQSPFVRFFLNSLIVAPTTVLTSLTVYGMAAYVLARFKFRLQKPLFTMFALTLLIPVTGIMVPVYRLMISTGLHNTKTALVIVGTALSMPVSLYILRSYFLTIPKEMEDAASIDGASFPRTYFSVILPIAQPGFATCAVLTFLGAWNEFLFALLLTTGDNARTVPIAVRYFQTEFSTNYGRMFAALVMIVVPIIIFYIILQKRIEQGLVAGSVKG